MAHRAAKDLQTHHAKTGPNSIRFSRFPVASRRSHGTFYLGNAKYDRLRPLSYPDCDVVIVCYDLSEGPNSIETVKNKVRLL